MSTKISDSFTGTGVSDTSIILNNFNVSVQGTFVGTVELQRSFDDGITWEMTDSFTEKVSTSGYECERKVLYRVECTAYTSGTIDIRVGSDGLN